MFSYSSDPVVFNYDDGAAGRDYLTRSGKPLKQKSLQTGGLRRYFSFLFYAQSPLSSGAKVKKEAERNDIIHFLNYLSVNRMYFVILREKYADIQ
ncbi:MULTISPECIES: hypothetical protein [Morganella]|uniref:hypothetical protein n=1 Tax=Morganella TaxID=581 RepID=UPI0008A5F0B7|nr:hypothetical protein [Morganella sp. HMSC11D09]HCR4429575.1 hypothetical protein [Morganella morganii]HDU8700932.1 hypothetical protein [Morganella morganii subsp. morganii]OFU98201.1 hypothetical protein HMPREF3119_12625 [Morganella sp. HMSC11D09]HCT3284237.1 hypothetical protein [Morganella morganii]HCT6323742.1 hypothetical protein [Morganella morganii]